MKIFSNEWKEQLIDWRSKNKTMCIMEHQNHHLIYIYIYIYPSPTLKLYIVLNGHDHITQGEGKYKKMQKSKNKVVGTSLIYK